MILYKIRNKKTGLFSTGGMSFNWAKGGKTWKRLNHVKAHITLVGKDRYKNCEIVYYIYSLLGETAKDIQ